MKILVIHDLCNIGGGTNIYRKTLSKLLEKEGVKTFTFTFADENEDNCYCYSFSKGIKFIRYIKYNYFNLPLFMALRNWIRKITPDIIHIHHNYIFTNTILLACRVVKIPIIQTVHDYRLICPIGTGIKKTKKAICTYNNFSLLCYHEGCISLKDFLVQFIPKKINKYLLKKVVTCFITPSMFMKEVLKNYGLEAVFIPFGIDYSRYSIISPNRQQNKILFIGDLYRSKGVDILLKAFCKVLEVVSDASLDIVGEGPEQDRLKDECKTLNLVDNVNFYGKIPHDELLEFYYRANIVVLPSMVQENSPLSIYEAMAAARPVIGSRIGGIPELITDGKTGLLFSPGDSNELSKKILQLLKDKDTAEKMGILARKRIETHFSQQKLLQEYLKIFKDVK
jgi:glycosyltransferase involved in cell wall biosynthesis